MTTTSSDLDPAWWAPGFKSVDDAEFLADSNGIHRSIHLYVGGLRDVRGGDAAGPQGFMVRMSPECFSGAHFHRVDQFQVFFGKDGSRFQRTAIPDGSVFVHYNDAYATYGPFESGPDGLELFVLRAVGDPFIGFMPGAREQLIHKGRRGPQHLIQIDREPQLVDGGTSVTSLIEDESDHLACRVITAGSNATVDGPPTNVGGGQYYCVLSGEVTFSGKKFEPKSLAWVKPGGEALRLEAGKTTGFKVLFLQFPSPASFEAPEPMEWNDPRALAR